MRTLLIAPLMLLATLCASVAAPFSHHQEGHPNAAKVIPPGWRLQPHDGNWLGSRFVSPDGSSWFAAYSSPVASEPVAAHMNTIAAQDGEAVTYFRREQDWLAVSGMKGNRIFYRKAVIACGGKTWHHIAFEYPAARKRQMDPFVVRASQSIDYAEYDSCGEPRSSAGRAP
jgi:hypothetical protein